ncbi:MAG TPA: OFA family MFS transporter [Thermodesulfobacteriota bacterium]|nr:OFA family MFS transporter [Deltaproteobacteria bacterium]HNR12981.1 OFA family MFS transporter [Thermodesulfobacteriota bacterium]
MVREEKLFGMPAEQGRWVFVLLGLVSNICLGSVYAWSVFKKPVEELFHIGATQSALPFTVFLAFFALLMPFAGKLIEKYGPRTVAIAGGIIVGLGWILSKYASDITFMTVTYGAIAGAGVGIVYGAPIAVSTRWFPDKKGLAVGLTLLGFGMSALITAPLAQKLIATRGVLPTFGIFGVAFLIITVALALPLRFPAAGWKPAGWNPPAAAAGATSGYNVGEMLKTPTFYGLWICYIIGALAGLMAIGISKPCGQEVVQCSATAAGYLVGVFAIFNGVGRPFFGWLTDKITPRGSAIVSFVIIIIASYLMIKAGPGCTGMYAVAFCGFWLCLGGWLAIAPTATATYFGTQFYSQIYGVVFTAYGLGAIIGNLACGRIRDLTGSYTYSFYLTGVLAILGILIALALLKPPKRG